MHTPNRDASCSPVLLASLVALSVGCGLDAGGDDAPEAFGGSPPPAPPSIARVTLSDPGLCPVEPRTYELRWEDGPPELIFEHQVEDSSAAAPWVRAFHNSRMYLERGASIQDDSLTSFAPAVYVDAELDSASFDEQAVSVASLDEAPTSGGWGQLTFQIHTVGGQLHVDPDVLASGVQFKMRQGTLDIEEHQSEGLQPVVVSFAGTARCVAPGAGVDTSVEVSGSCELYKTGRF